MRAKWTSFAWFVFALSGALGSGAALVSPGASAAVRWLSALTFTVNVVYAWRAAVNALEAERAEREIQ